MALIGECVKNGKSGIIRQCLHAFLAVAPVADCVKHLSEDPCRVLYALLFAELGRGRIEIYRIYSQIRAGNLKGAPGPGAGLFKYESHVFCCAGRVVIPVAVHLERKVYEELYFISRKVKEL